MDPLAHELNILSRATAYKNLSGASVHVGLSQPQLSRIIKRLEESYSLVLLDRSAKRSATWTPIAYRLAAFYHKKARAFDRDLEALVASTRLRQLQIGTLEGLIPVALPFAHAMLHGPDVRTVEIDVFDLDRLEELFARGEVDLIFTSRQPGRKKHRYLRELGYQSLDWIESNRDFSVLSTFEFGRKRERSRGAEKLLVSNSLLIRREWFERYGGSGTLPSRPKRQRSSSADTEPILLLGAETLSPALWKALEKVSAF